MKARGGMLGLRRRQRLPAKQPGEGEQHGARHGCHPGAAEGAEAERRQARRYMLAAALPAWGGSFKRPFSSGARPPQ